MAAAIQRTERNVDSDLDALEAMANEFEDYIIDGDVYRTVLVTTSRGNYRVEMSGGDLMARIAILQQIREELTGGLKDRLNSVITQVATTKQELKTKFHQLLERELRARLDRVRWAEDERKQEEDEEEQEEQSPAETHNQHCIQLIREELEQ